MTNAYHRDEGPHDIPTRILEEVPQVTFVRREKMLLINSSFALILKSYYPAMHLQNATTNLGSAHFETRQIQLETFDGRQGQLFKIQRVHRQENEFRIYSVQHPQAVISLSEANCTKTTVSRKVKQYSSSLANSHSLVLSTKERYVDG